eukprot:5034530-Amphidinium_carterae.1
MTGPHWPTYPLARVGSTAVQLGSSRYFVPCKAAANTCMSQYCCRRSDVRNASKHQQQQHWDSS